MNRYLPISVFMNIRECIYTISFFLYLDRHLQDNLFTHLKFPSRD